MSGAGDFNGDGVSDVIVGANRANHPGFADIGVAYVIFGHIVTSVGNAFGDIQLTTIALDPAIGFRMLGAAADSWFGYSVSAAGDVNSDGFDDVIVGSIFADPPTLPGSNAGIAYVIFGQNTTTFTDLYISSLGASTPVGFQILGAAAGDQTGLSVSAAGDVNNDGRTT